MKLYICHFKKKIVHGWLWGYRNILTRRVPHALLSWYFFMPNPSKAVKSHRNVLLHAWPQLPRPVWWGILLYSYLGWYGLFAWPRIFNAWQRHKYEVRSEHCISYARQLYHLWMVAYLHAIPPRFYYRYRLYLYEQSRWLHFLYTNELPHWHHLMSPEATRKSRQLMQDKVLMAEVFSSKGIPVIETLAVVKQGEAIAQDFLDKFEQSVFIKPVLASRMVGCFEYHRVKNGKGKLLSVGKNANSRISDWEHLANILKQYSIVIQPLLINSERVAQMVGSEELTSIRIITQAGETGIKAVSAILEVVDRPSSGSIDLETGAMKRAEAIGSEGEECLLELDELLAIVFAAHRLVSDIQYIGWDLAITQSGHKLIEGNVNWQAERVQQRVPLLELVNAHSKEVPD